MEWLFWPPKGLVHHYSALGTRSRITPCARNKLHARYQHSTSQGGVESGLPLAAASPCELAWRSEEILKISINCSCCCRSFSPYLNIASGRRPGQLSAEGFAKSDIFFHLHPRYDYTNVFQFNDTTIPSPRNSMPTSPLTPRPLHVFSTAWRLSRPGGGGWVLYFSVLCYSQATHPSSLYTTW